MSSGRVDMETINSGLAVRALRKGVLEMSSLSMWTVGWTATKLSFAAALLIATVVGHAKVISAASAPTRVAIAYPSPSPRVAPLWVAQDLDFFGKYGLRAQIVLVRNNQMLTAGFAAGDINVAYTGGTT